MNPKLVAAIGVAVLAAGVAATAGIAAAQYQTPAEPAPKVEVIQRNMALASQPMIHANQSVPIPEELANYVKPTLQYPNLGSQLDPVASEAEAERQQQDGREVATVEPIAVTVYLSSNVDEVVDFLIQNGVQPRNVGEDYIEANVPPSLLGELSEQDGVLWVRELQRPQWR